MIKTTAYSGKQNNVHFINGYVSLAGVTLNAYSFSVDGLLIDTGAPRLLKLFKPFFEEAEFDQVVITHAHEDHIGGAAFLQKKFKVPILMNELTVAESNKKAKYPLYRQVFWGRREPFQAQAIGKSLSSRSAAWDVIKTPGHARDHLSFLNKETGQLFSGDLFVQPRTNLILRDESIPMIMDSIEKVLTFDFQEVFCCHAGYVKDGRKALSKKLDNLKELQEKVLTLRKQGYLEKEIQAKLFAKKYPITYFSLGEWDSIHMIRSILNS
ncbi:MBL fold metallo-hydrolase [Ornithinibacillus sp. 179-J 7C1 HS]|uniref:MBL fold metallo-hydrolase n=1 Tax=Ornithinibacillus sp. 179-J 7C1 HS TaxID=3142384 RepID=UPI0039A0B033